MEERQGLIMKKNTIVASLLVTGLLFTVLGCNESHAQKKKVMVEKWEQSSTSAQLPAIENMLEQGQIQKAKAAVLKCLKANPDMPDALILMGRIYAIEGHDQQAHEVFEKIVKLDPKSDQAWNYLGSLAVLDKDYQRALECYQHAVDLMPANTDYAVDLSEIYVETNQLEKAHQIINQALSKHPDNLDLMLSKAKLLQQIHLPDKAIEVYEQAQIMHGDIPEILEPAGYAYISQKNWAKAAEKFKLLEKQYPEDDPRHNVTMRSLAKCLFNAQQYASALFWYDKLSVIYRDDLDVWLNMAQASLELNNPSRAAYCANKAIQINPSSSQAYAVLGCAHYMQGSYSPALKAFYKITDDKKLGGFAWFMSGRCYQKQGRNRQANLAFERAEKLDPDNELIASFLDKTVHPL
jgi:tetratricopeptide (TPR) repeat protein